MNEVVELINGVGFPIAASIFMAVLNIRLTNSIAELNKTLAVINERIGKIETEIEKGE